MPFRSRTLRRFPPVTRKYAKLTNDLELIVRRAKAMVEDMQHLEIDSQALWKIHEAKEKGEVTGEGMGEKDKQMISKVSQDFPF